MKRCLCAVALAMLLIAQNRAIDGNDKRTTGAFGALEAASPEAVRAQTQAWLKSVGKEDLSFMQQFQAIWARDERSVLDRVADTFALGDERAAKVLAEANEPVGPAPTAVPDILKDTSLPIFFRANLGLAYARALSNRRVHDEALATLKVFQPEQVVAPATYLFVRAVCEHATLQKPEATRSIARLLEDSAASPERYRTVAALMLLDMQTWQDKDLGAVARKMNVIGERLDIARGGPQTQKLQKDVIARLDELIKELENKAKGQCNCNGGGCPNGGQPGNGGANPSAPMQDSRIANNGGSGRVDPQKMKNLLDQWGKLPPREQARALQELTRGMSPRHREAIENYFRNIASAQK